MAVAPPAAAPAMGGGSCGPPGLTQLSRSLERLLEEAALSGELRLNGRKLKELPRAVRELTDTVKADLRDNLLTELPEELAAWRHLETLLAARNAVRRVPAALAALTALTCLDLSDNQLSSLPRAVCQLPLQVLLLADNRLEGLPPELGRLSLLAELDVARNRLTELPFSIGDLACLRALYLADNALALLPTQMTRLRLHTLDVSCNCISSLPLELRHMTSLVSLRVDNNPLVSPPATVCMRGRVHIFQYLETLESREGGSGGARRGVEARRPRPHPVYTPPVYSPLDLRQRHLQHDQAASNDADSSATEGASGSRSAPGTPSTLSPGASVSRAHDFAELSPHGPRRSPGSPLVNGEDKQPHAQQTYREYKEALRQQRQQDVYRPRGDLTPPTPPTPASTPDASPAHTSTPVQPRRPVQKVVPSRNVHKVANGSAGACAEQNGHATPPWHSDPVADKLSFTMKRELDKQKEESELLHQLRTIIESRLKMSLPEQLAPVLADGVVLCHLANHVRPRSVASVHVPCAAQPKLTMARCRRNVDNFLQACRNIGVEEKLMCCAADVLEGRGLVQLAITVTELLRRASAARRTPPAHHARLARTQLAA